MKKILLIITLTLSLLAEKNIMPENTVAVVNGMALFEDDLQQQIDVLMPKSSYHNSIKGDKFNDLKAKAMEALIDSTLLYQYALSIGIKEDKSVMEGVYEKLLKKTGSKEAVEIELKKLGLSIEKLSKLYGKNSVHAQLYVKEIQVMKTEAELKEYYEKNKYKFKEPEKVRVSLIYVKNDPTDPSGRANGRAKIEEALKKIKNGENFADIARKYSDDMSRIKGGDMGFLHRGRLYENVEKEAFSMKNGEMSGIIEKDVGFYIVKVTDKQEPNQLSFQDIKNGLEKDLIKKEEEKKKTDLLNKLRAKAKIIKQ